MKYVLIVTMSKIFKWGLQNGSSGKGLLPGLARALKETELSGHCGYYTPLIPALVRLKLIDL